MRRPQKPFAVEVKRGRKSAAAASSALVFRQPEPSAVRPAVKVRPAVSTPERSKPERRILEAIVEAIVEANVEANVEPPTIDVALDVAEPVVAPVKRRVGRPPKAPRLAEPKIKRVAPARDAEFLIYTPEPREVFHVTASPEPSVAPRRAPKKSASDAVHVPHGERGEASANLPRGERWKRRLPKVLW